MEARSVGVDTLLLTRNDVVSLMTPADYLLAARDAFGALGRGDVEQPQPLSLFVESGAFHAKGAAIASQDRRFAAVKINGNFPANAAKGLPTIQGVVVLSDASDGRVLALIDSIELTLRRTAAASAFAAERLARVNAKNLAVIGCGAQASAQIDAMLGVRSFVRLSVFDIDAGRAQALGDGYSTRLDMHIASNVAKAASDADVIVTCTTAARPILDDTHVRNGAFIAAVGADKAGKSEIAPALMARSRVFVDSHKQCLDMGDLRNAVEAGFMKANDIAGDLGALITGRAEGRRDDNEIIIFDSTGLGLQDVAAAVVIYERAAASGIGACLQFGS